MDSDQTDHSGDNAQSPAVESVLSQFAGEPGGLLPALHAIQREAGYIPDEAIAAIAEAFNLSRAEVHGVVSFYHFFRTSPGGETTVYVCRAEACQAMGGRLLESHAQEKLKVGWHGTTSDGRYTLEPVYCLGNCACAPAMMVGDSVHGRVNPEKFDEILG